MFLSPILAARGAGLALAGLVLPISGAAQPPVMLTCTNLASAFSWQSRSDFEQRTVDSNPGRISRTEISWHGGADGGNYTLDRKSGNLTVIFASSTGGYFIHDRCRPQI